MVKPGVPVHSTGKHSSLSDNHAHIVQVLAVKGHDDDDNDDDDYNEDGDDDDGDSENDDPATTLTLFRCLLKKFKVIFPPCDGAPCRTNYIPHCNWQI